MAQQPSDSLQYLRDTIGAYRRRFDREGDKVLRDYMWSRIVELENQLMRLTGAAVNGRSLGHISQSASPAEAGRQAET